MKQKQHCSPCSRALRWRNARAGAVRNATAAFSPPHTDDPAPVATLQARVRRGQTRGLALRHLDAARPQSMTDLALLALIRTVYADASSGELRRELHYLALQGLLTVAEKNGHWLLSLTGQGVDLVSLRFAHRPLPSTTARRPLMTVPRFKAWLRSQGKTIRQWAEENGYPPGAVYRVLNGVDKAHFGRAHAIAVKAGIKPPADERLAA